MKEISSKIGVVEDIVSKGGYSNFPDQWICELEVRRVASEIEEIVD